MTDTPPPPAPGQPTATQIGDLLAWCRRLTEIGPGRVDTAELVAYQAAKTKLLARITSTAGHPDAGVQAGEA